MVMSILVVKPFTNSSTWTSPGLFWLFELSILASTLVPNPNSLAIDAIVLLILSCLPITCFPFLQLIEWSPYLSFSFSHFLQTEFESLKIGIPNLYFNITLNSLWVRYCLSFLLGNTLKISPAYFPLFEHTLVGPYRIMIVWGKINYNNILF